VIADPRNDENLMLASLHAAILRFHNAAHARTSGAAQARFEEAPTLPAAYSGGGEFRMIDFLAFAGVAPA